MPKRKVRPPLVIGKGLLPYLRPYTRELAPDHDFGLERHRYGPVLKRVATDIVIRNHYLHSKPLINEAFSIGMAHERYIIWGVATFGTPMWSVSCGLVGEKKADLKRPDANWHRVWELNRLWLNDKLPWRSESQFLGWCFRELKKKDSHRIIVSYADTAEGHEGYLYRALGFIYTGMSIAWVDKTIEGQDHRSVSRERLKGSDVVRKTRSRKHRYVKFLDPGDKKLLAWPEVPYPKAKPLA